MDRTDIWDLTPDVLVLVDEDDLLVDANRSCEMVLGWPRTALVGRPLAALLVDDPEAAAGERSWRCADGSSRWLLTSCLGEPEGTRLVMGRDVAGVAEHLHQVVRSEALLDEAERMARIGSWEWSIGSDAAVGTRQLRAMLGFGDVPASYGQLIRRVHPDDRARVEQVFLHSLTTGEPFECEFRVRRPDGGELVVYQIGRCTMRDGVPVRMQGTIQDVTEQRRLEADLRQAQKLESVGRLARGIAHDFNNYLQVVIGYVSVVAEELERSADRPDVVHKLRQALQGADRAVELTRQMLLFARPPAGQPRVVDVAELVETQRPLWRGALGERSDLQVRVGRRPVPVYCDPAQLEQVLMNLVMNARDALPDGGHVVVAVDVHDGEEHAGSRVTLTVHDTGHGMDALTLERVVEPFFTTKGPEHGTGLGLSMAYGIVTRLGGALVLESEPGAGTTVTVHLPLAEVDERELPPAVLPGGTETVLVVDGDDAVRQLVEHVLVRHGYTVLAAADHATADDLACAHVGPIHLLLADLRPGRGDARELASRLQALRPAMATLYLSASVEDGLPDGSVLDKPVSALDLASRVRAVLDRR